MNPDLSNLDRLFLEKALKDTPSLKVGGTVPKSMNKGFSDLPLFERAKQTDLFSQPIEKSHDGNNEDRK